MKKVLTTLFLLTAIAAGSYAQELRINTYAGYVFKDKVDSYYSKVPISTVRFRMAFVGGLV
ncbi:hypothetical protein [uncultured Algoriphagus sp.]|uniref:hypothetical protein n=1 Tax=uncultured Algoriphagus sp. TaxID=417365 RepID=UPI0030EB5124